MMSSPYLPHPNTSSSSSVIKRPKIQLAKGVSSLSPPKSGSSTLKTCSANTKTGSANAKTLNSVFDPELSLNVVSIESQMSGANSNAKESNQRSENLQIFNNNLKLTATNGTNTYLENLGKTLVSDFNQSQESDIRIHCKGGRTVEASKQVLLLGSHLFRSLFRSECTCMVHLSVVYDIYCPDFDPDVLARVLESLAACSESIECLSERETSEVKSILEAFKICIPFEIDLILDPQILCDSLIKTEASEEGSSYNDETFYNNGVFASSGLASVFENQKTKADDFGPDQNQLTSFSQDVDQMMTDNQFSDFCQKDKVNRTKQRKRNYNEKMFSYCTECSTRPESHNDISYIHHQDLQSSFKFCSKCRKPLNDLPKTIDNQSTMNEETYYPIVEVPVGALWSKTVHGNPKLIDPFNYTYCFNKARRANLHFACTQKQSKGCYSVAHVTTDRMTISCTTLHNHAPT